MVGGCESVPAFRFSSDSGLKRFAYALEFSCPTGIGHGEYRNTENTREQLRRCKCQPDPDQC